MLKHKFLLAGVVVLAAAGAGGAYAATQSSTNPRQALINDVARRLNVSPSQVTSAIKGALLDQLQAAVRAGRITQSEADRIKQHIESGRLPFGPAGPFGPGGQFGPRGPFGPGGRWHHGDRFEVKKSLVSVAAAYLGLSQSQFLSDLQAGKTPAQVAQARGKSVSGLEQALVGAVKARLDQLVSSGQMTKDEEQRRLARVTARLAQLVEHGLPAPPTGPPAPGPGPFGSPPPGA